MLTEIKIIIQNDDITGERISSIVKYELTYKETYTSQTYDIKSYSFSIEKEFEDPNDILNSPVIGNILKLNCVAKLEFDKNKPENIVDLSDVICSGTLISKD